MVVIAEILVVAAIVLAVAGFISGSIPGMTAAPLDAAGDGLPDGEITSTDVDHARFGLAFRGYRMSEVDAVIDRMRDEMARYESQLARRDALAEPGESGESTNAPAYDG